MSSLWVPAVARAVVGTKVGVVLSAHASSGVFYLAALNCNQNASLLPPCSVEGVLHIAPAGSANAEAAVSAVTRAHWWIAGAFTVQLGLFAFAAYNFPRGWDQRVFWMPFGIVVALYLVVALIEFPLSGERLYSDAVARRVLMAVRSSWRGIASAYLAWIFVGPFWQGTRARLAVWLRWGCPAVGSAAAAVPAVAAFVGSSVAGEWLRVVGVTLWTVLFWGSYVWTIRLHLAANKKTLDGARSADAATPVQELAKRGALRLLRGASTAGAVCATAATALTAGSLATQRAVEVLCDGALVVSLGAVLVGLILNYQSPTFVNIPAHVDVRRRFIAGLAGVAQRMRRMAPAPRRQRQPPVARAPPLEEDSEGREERHYDLSATAPPPEFSDDHELVHTTTDAEDDITAPDTRNLINSNN